MSKKILIYNKHFCCTLFFITVYQISNTKKMLPNLQNLIIFSFLQRLLNMPVLSLRYYKEKPWQGFQKIWTHIPTDIHLVFVLVFLRKYQSLFLKLNTRYLINPNDTGWLHCLYFLFRFNFPAMIPLWVSY